MEIRKVVDCVVPFKEITQGEVFMFGREYYIKMEEFGNQYNAVNLCTGRITHFSEDERVAPIDNCYLAVE